MKYKRKLVGSNDILLSDELMDGIRELIKLHEIKLTPGMHASFVVLLEGAIKREIRKNEN